MQAGKDFLRPRKLADNLEHGPLMRLYYARYTEQIETADAATILTRWE
jgi:hypothetical protein